MQRDVAKAIADFGNRKKAEALTAVEEYARSLGFSLAELNGAKVRTKRAGSGIAKFRHPENPEVTWSGFGRKPAWFVAAIEAGKSPDSMAV